MKKAELKSFTFLLIMMLLLSVVTVFGATSTTLLTEDNFQFLADNLNLKVVVNASGDDNISRIDLFHNINGSWEINSTQTIDNTTRSVIVMFNLSGVADDTTFKWGVTVYNRTDGDRENVSVRSDNRTAFVDYAPVVKLEGPADSGWMGDTLVGFDINVTRNASGTINATAVYQCQIYNNNSPNNNGSGVWRAIASVQVGGTNRSNVSTDLPQTAGLIWNARCYEKNDEPVYAFASSNFTIKVDSITPVITQVTAQAGFDNDNSYGVNWSIVEANPSTCVLYHNGNTTWNSNHSRSYFTNFTDIIVPITNTSQTGTVVSSNIYCSDSVGHVAWGSSNLTFTEDTVYPTLVVGKNNSVDDSCTGFRMNNTANEPVNATFLTNYTGSNVYDRLSDYSISRESVINFNNSYRRRTFIWNMSVCDQAGNCNDSKVNYNVRSLLPLCTGFSAYSMTETSRTMSNLTDESGAEISYWWNHANQRWTTFVDGATTNQEVNIVNGSAIWFYTSTGSQWDRLEDQNQNLTGPPWNTSLGAGHNFVGLYGDRTAYNLSLSFKAPTEINFTWGSAFNNTAQRYVDFGWNLTWNNLTNFEFGIADVIHIWSATNTTWNRTARI